jgi:HD-like signal output (HDOD) protein
MSAVVAEQEKPLRGLFTLAYRDIVAGKVALPSMPDVALRIRAAMQKEQASIADVGRVVSADASTAAYLLGVANSPIYRGVTRITDVDKCIMRLGLVTTRNLVTAYALRAMFSTRSGTLARLMSEIWRQSARTAAFAAILARRDGRFSPDQAMLGGLLQDIGVLPLIKVLSGRPRALRERDRLRPSLREFGPRVGVVLLERWNFDPELVEVVRQRQSFARDTGGPVDLADLVLVARRLAAAGTVEDKGLPTFESMAAFSKLALGRLTMQETLDMLLAADEEVREIMQLLGVSA